MKTYLNGVWVFFLWCFSDLICHCFLLTLAAVVSSICPDHPRNAPASRPLYSGCPAPGQIFAWIPTWLTPLTMSGQYSMITSISPEVYFIQNYILLLPILPHFFEILLFFQAIRLYIFMIYLVFPHLTLHGITQDFCQLHWQSLTLRTDLTCRRCYIMSWWMSLQSLLKATNIHSWVHTVFPLITQIDGIYHP